MAKWRTLTHPIVKYAVYNDDLLTIMITKLACHVPMLNKIVDLYKKTKVRSPWMCGGLIDRYSDIEKKILNLSCSELLTFL